jgi:primosomal protein N' (replication factor Y)
MRAIVRVIVDAPIAQPLDYLAPETSSADKARALIGSLCIVPLGTRRLVGIVVGNAADSAVPHDKLRPLVASLGEIAPLSAHWLELTRFAADYYQHAWGELAVPALPPTLRKPPGPRFAAALARLRKAPAARARPARDPLALNAEQAAAVQAIAAARGFACHLLFGVTGSGKTEVYLEAMAQRLAADPQAQALLLVPEIGLTPQLLARVQARFPHERVVSLHSGLAAGERTAGWLAAHEGRARIVVGTRLAVFASLPHLALIAVDEEHDHSFKSGEGQRYSARDLAIKRAQMAGVPVVLGSATPSLESWANAQAGKYHVLRLPQRAAAGEQPAWPEVACVNIKGTRPPQGLAAEVRAALAETVARGEQALVFLNRRGYAPVVACDACGWVSTCGRCAVFAAFHKTDGTLRCHHCGWQQRIPRACPTCGNQDLQAVGQGTQRIEEALAEAAPGARIARIDRDSVRRKGEMEQAFDAVHAGDVDILVGTQMITKGHDFRRVSLVVVLGADARLVAHDFRAPEHLFATLVQVAGRAGRSGLASRVLVQTRYPAHPLFAALARYDYEGFAQAQLQERRAARLPPYMAQALLAVEDKGMAQALEFLAAARTLAPEARMRRYDPVPMPLAQLAGVYRAQLLVEAASRSALQQSLARWLPEVRALAQTRRPRPRWHIDVDPLEI